MLTIILLNLLLFFREFFSTDNPFADLVAAACTPMDAFVNKESQGFRPKEAPVTKPLKVTLEEVFNGGVRKAILPRKVLSEDGASLEVKDNVLTVQIPRGADQGMEFNFPNAGDELPGMQPADVIFQLQLQPHPVFRREKNNLVMRVTVNLYEALCGVVIPVNMLDGRTFRVFNVHLVQPGYEKIITGEGMPLLDEPGKRGDLIIRFRVRYPNMLTQAQKLQLKSALDPSGQKGLQSCYDRRPPATNKGKGPKKCICPEEEDDWDQE